MSEDWAGLNSARAVWDFTTGDARRFNDRLQLAIDALEEFRRRNIAVDFVMLLHGPATQFAARTLAGTKFDEREAPEQRAIHARLQQFADMGGRIEVCGIAMERSAIAPDNLIVCVTVERNVYVNSIALQNHGYAYLPIP